MSSPASKKLIHEGTILFISTLLVNAGNYGINLLLGRWLGPADFSEVSLLVTLMLMLSFLALAFQLTAAKYVAEYAIDATSTKHYIFLSWLRKMALYTGISLSVVLITLSFFLRDFFQTHSLTPFIIFGIGMPIYLLMSINRGILQGLGNYKKLAISYQVEMWVRLILSVALVSVGLGVNGVALGLTGSLIATLLVTAYRIPTVEKQDFNTQAIKRFLAMILLYEFSQILINNSDTILVKHYFPPHEAGLYAALALIGRIVYFGTWTIVTLLFPTVIKLEKEGKNHLPLFMGGLGVVALMATGIIGACYWFPDWIVLGLFGKAYLSITVYLWYYALATALFACANVFVYYNLSLERRFPVWLTLVGGCSQVALLALFHDNFMQVINLQIYVMLALFGAMVCYQITVTKISIATSLQG